MVSNRLPEQDIPEIPEKFSDAATTDVRQAAGYDLWLAAVLTLSARIGHSQSNVAAPKESLYQV